MEEIQIKNLAKLIVQEMDTMHNADLAPKWEDGTVIFKPEDPDMKEHEIPIEVMLHKIVMVRNNLRVLEQNINSCASLSEGEKVKFQSYISKIYGSLTSFNFIFADKKDKFSS